MPPSGSPSVTHPTLPEGQLLYAVGDIHGRLDLLQRLLDLIRPRCRSKPGRQAHTRLSRRLCRPWPRQPRRGRAADRRLAARLRRSFSQGQSRGHSARFPRGAVASRSLAAEWRRRDHAVLRRRHAERSHSLGRPGRPGATLLPRRCPRRIFGFFRNLQLSVSFGDYLFVHAGVRPGVPLAAQSEADLIWIRAPFLNHAEPFGKIVVHGHTPGQEPVTRPNRVGIDTGAVFTGRLTALRLRGRLAGRFLQT